MAITLSVYKFSKHKNSTLTPDSTLPHIDITGEFKVVTSILTPSLIISDNALPSGVSIAAGYNYCYIPTFARYYFIEDWTWSNGLWVLTLSCDVMATFKTSIQLYTGYVLRTASNTYVNPSGSTVSAWNGDVADSYYPMTATPTIGTSTLETPFITSLTSGTYIVGIINSLNSLTGCTCYYAMNYTQFRYFKQFLLSDTFANRVNGTSAGSTDLTLYTLKAFYNPMQYIVSCMWMPIAYSAIGETETNTIDIGWWQITSSDESHIGGKILAADIATASQTFTITDHPQVARGSYLNKPPYRTATIFYPVFGQIPIDIAAMNSSKIRILFKADMQSGNCTMQIQDNSDSANPVTIYQIKSKIGIDISLAQITSSDAVVGTVTSTANGILDAEPVQSAIDSAAEALDLNNNNGLVSVLLKGLEDLTGIDSSSPTAASNINPYSVARSTVNGIRNAATGANTNVTILSGAGDFGAYSIAPSLSTTYNLIADEDRAHLGRPSCKSIRLGALSGFTMVQNPEVAATGATATENAAINNYLATGFYME